MLAETKHAHKEKVCYHCKETIKLGDKCHYDDTIKKYLCDVCREDWKKQGMIHTGLMRWKYRKGILK